MVMVRVLVMMMHKKMAVMIWMARKTTVIAIFCYGLSFVLDKV